MNHKTHIKNLAINIASISTVLVMEISSSIPSTKHVRGRRRRYRCKECGKTFASTYGTAYYRRQSSTTSFDEVVTMSVNGIDKSTISRVKNLSWNTIERWLERASKQAHHFNHHYLKGYEITEVQPDEIRTFVGSKKNV